MEKQELKTKWDELARELGAEVPPETQQREEAVETAAKDATLAQPAEPTVPTATARSPLPKRSAVDWDNLAGELGLPPVEPAPRTKHEEQPESARDEPSKRPAVERPQREHRPQRESAGSRRESPRERPEPTAKRREPRKFGGDVSAESRSEVGQEFETPAPPPAGPREEPMKPSTAVSLWHKIFGSPTEQSAKLTEISTGASDAPEPSERRDEGPSIGDTTEIRSLSGEDVTAARFVEELDRGEESTFEADDTSVTERPRGRSRRRRRGRGRKSDQRQTDERTPARDGERLAKIEDDSDIDDEFRDIESESEHIGSEEFHDDDDVDDATDDSEIGAISSNRARAAQRTIPSWEEAIGFIVDTNMQSRSQRRASSRPESRGGPSRGRPRGRRKN